MKTFTITIKGKTESDIEDAIIVVSNQIRDGFLAGFDSNDSGSYHYESKGEYKANSK